MKNNLLKIVVALILLGSSATHIMAQTPVEDLQKAVEIYNAMKEYSNGLDPKTITQSNVDDVKARMDKSVALLDKVIREGNADQIKVGRYFRNNAKYQYSFVLGMKGENAKSYEVMKEIERDLTSFTSSDFPLRYEFFGKNYIINWDNFGPTQAEFLTGYAEVCFNLGKYDDAIKANKKAVVHPNLTEWLQYISVNKMLDIEAKKSGMLTPEEHSNFALQAMEAYDKQTTENKEVIKENNYPTVKRAMEILVRPNQGTTTPQHLARWAKAAPIGVKYDEENPNTLRLFELCYRNNVSEITAWHKVANNYAQVAKTHAQLGKPLNASTAEYVGLSAVDRIAAGTSTSDCEALREVAKLYGQWDNPAKKTEYDKKAETCIAEQKKAQERANKIARRNNRDFNLYVGLDLFPVLNTNPKRDYGVVANFVFENAAIEFGYKKVRNNKENIFDLWINEVDDADQDNLSRWDGFKAHVQPKFFTKNSDNGYFGIVLGYNEKNFDSMAVNVLSDLDGSYFSHGFKPSVKQYVAMLNFGGMVLGKGFGVDMHFGFGANYSQFDPGTTLDRTTHTIENPLLEHRKDSYWGVVLHMGITMGLNFGPGRS
jgi:tetratricopeptide (TPR) repeat protein